MLRATEDPDDLKGRVEAARDLAARRLIEAQNPDGTWFAPIRFGAFPSAVFVIMMRTTGLIERPGQMDIEANLLRSLLRFQNPDGGFWKYEGSPSSLLLSQICRAVIGLALGDIPGNGRPSGWFRKNPLWDSSSEAELRRALRRCESFCAEGGPMRAGESERELLLLSPLLVAHACGVGRLSRFQRWGLAFMDISYRLPGLFFFGKHLLHRLAEAVWPALMILVAGVRLESVSPGRMRGLASRIRSSQDEAGGWEIGSAITMLNVMALVRAGVSADDPAVEKAHAWLIREFLDEEDWSFAPARNHCCITGYALDSLLRMGASPDAGGPAGKALDFLLSAQTADGGYCFGASLRRDAEADSVAHAIRSFRMASTCCDERTGERIRDAMNRGADFMLARQHSRGGFSCYKRSIIDGHRGSSGVLEQAFFDLPTPDISARILETLADCGMGSDHRAARKALGFLLRTQCANGAWWSRWWAGYLVGVSFVLRAYAKLGLGLGEPPGGDPLLRRSHAAMLRAVEFLLGHQNADGGWGETTDADTDIALAGIGWSTPLHTAHITSSLLRLGYSADDPVIIKAMRFLLATMSPDGRWSDRQVTFTFLARCIYYRCDFLNLVLPLDALNDYLAHPPRGVKTDESPGLPSARRHA